MDRNDTRYPDEDSQGFDTEAEAREHAHLIARALREVTVDEG